MAWLRVSILRSLWPFVWLESLLGVVDVVVSTTIVSVLDPTKVMSDGTCRG
ncbi:unnamed protein product [Arabidopsis lyrata]|uniref:Predicted protein n=1 Tax=Arabidopsis lyrata subsp. lyrata TaxID=81972 RepID=D7MAK6_ARALL|nr:predicted protein [Arabidopsis lyrata subsp. lyrata]CAH8276585.1 unnamed protein product [Arabidopsis lyrata]